MSNEIKPVSNTPITVANTTGNSPLAFTQTGDNGTQIGHADTVNAYVSVNMVSGTMQPNGTILRTGTTLSHEYYNLFVVGTVESFDGTDGSFLMMSQRAMEYTDDAIRSRLLHLTDEDRVEIQSFPSLFLAENAQYGKANPEQYAYFGRVLEIRPHGEKHIKVKYHFIKEIPQERLNELSVELGIHKEKCYSELNRTHWAIKQIDLLDELTTAHIDLL